MNDLCPTSFLFLEPQRILPLPIITTTSPQMEIHIKMFVDDSSQRKDMKTHCL
uniref:Uncharacterized protein n=1 Tax=Arundo donax TaxID=35708 RepID=A0A0A9HE01_ARUDO